MEYLRITFWTSSSISLKVSIGLHRELYCISPFVISIGIVLFGVDADYLASIFNNVLYNGAPRIESRLYFIVQSTKN